MGKMDPKNNVATTGLITSANEYLESSMPPFKPIAISKKILNVSLKALGNFKSDFTRAAKIPKTKNKTTGDNRFCIIMSYTQTTSLKNNMFKQKKKPPTKSCLILYKRCFSLFNWWLIFNELLKLFKDLPITTLTFSLSLPLI